MFRGDRLRDLREDQDLQQKELAAILNLKPGTISNYETGVSPPKFAVLLDLANYFDVSIDYFYERTNNPKSHKLIIPDNIIILPKAHTNEIRIEITEFLQYLKTKYKID